MNCLRGSRSLHIAAVLAAFWCCYAPPCRAADKISWGVPVSKLRSGVAIGTGKTGLELHIYFQNLAPCSQTVLLEHGPSFPMEMDYSFSILASGPDGVRHQFLSASPRIGGFVKIDFVDHIVRHITPGGTYEMSQPFKVLHAKDVDIPLERRLREGSMLYVSYNVRQDREVGNLWLRYPDIWTGELESGKVGLPPNAH